nr:MAG TPA: hypothetical protein [Caudoviricetes sp.]DAL11449.1 MAG TPA_asm: hypothetical protein [Caudoviricetes sp.]DAV02278.1 MAG TPA: hypothetical protein [Caudoviricetes sp.]
MPSFIVCIHTYHSLNSPIGENSYDVGNFKTI